ncbi:hypothetical protein T4C_10777 [Trichinella pseudospiralis]|uniref:Uncharacterized protein n=1 Tax=Trichinella pseudospiralis TaxID=6337 RepID=A0A0V1JUG8_TRIPS|nr:hypothetical protein T4C_10777 [Trichinella pseudospiralis]
MVSVRAHQLSCVPPCRSGSSNPVPVYSESCPESRHCGPCPGSHGCLQSNFRSCSKYQYICLDALWSLLSFSNSVTHHRSLPYSLDGHFAFWNIPCGSVFTFMQLITMMVMYNNYSAMRRTDDNK